MAAIEYFSNSPTYGDLSRWLSATVNAEVLRMRFETAGLDPVVVAKASQQIPTDTLGLVSKSTTGEIVRAEKTNRGAEIGVPVGMMMLMLMVVMVGASPLVQSILEEKMQRIAEVLLGSIPPFQLMMGKLLGTVGVSLTISAVYLSGVYAALCYLGYAHYFPSHLLVWFLAYNDMTHWRCNASCNAITNCRIAFCNCTVP